MLPGAAACLLVLQLAAAALGQPAAAAEASAAGAGLAALLDQPAQAKPRPVNFTLVNQLFGASLDLDQLLGRWRAMDARLQEAARSILKLVFPQIVAVSQDARVSGDCSGAILKWILSLRNLRSWAIKMLDATGKPAAGVLRGALTMFGNYRQCLAIRAPDEDEIEVTDQFEEYFRGQFCVLHLKPWMPAKRPYYHLNATIESLLRKDYKYYERTLYDELAEIAVAFNFVHIRLDLCVPSTCTRADVQRVAELLSGKLELRAKVMRCDSQPRDAPGLVQRLDRPALAWLCLPLASAALVLVATTLSVLGLHHNKSAGGAPNGPDARRSRANALAHLVECLSIQGVLKDRLRVPKAIDSTTMDDNNNNHTDLGQQRATIQLGLTKPLPLYGLRNLFIFWFIIVQMTVELNYQYLRESLALRNMLLNYWPFQIIINSVLLFDSIILITAFTFAFSNLESNLKELVRYVFDKYLRLFPSIVAFVALTIITPFFDIDSPVWKNFMVLQADVCRETGYLNLFFLQNFISYEKICLPHTWLFCAELQLIIISIPIVLLLKKTFVDNEDSIIEQDEEHFGSCFQFRKELERMFKSRMGFMGLLLIGLGATINFVFVYINQLPPTWFYTFPDVDQKNYYFGKYLSRTWAHLTAFFVGLFAGHLVRSTLQLSHLRRLKSALSTPTKLRANNKATNGFNYNYDNQCNQMNGSTLLTVGQNDHAGLTRRENIGPLSLKFSIQFGAIACMAAVIFSTYSWSTQEAPSTLVAALYDSLSRLIWSLGLVTIVIYLCLPEDFKPNGSKSTSSFTTSSHPTQLARFFSHRGFIQLGRLSFLAYLISPYVHNFILAVEEQSLFPSLFLIFHVIVGNLVITYLMAFILSIVIEQPIRLLLAKLNCRTRSSARFFMPEAQMVLKGAQLIDGNNAKTMTSHLVINGNHTINGQHQQSSTKTINDDNNQLPVIVTSDS